MTKDRINELRSFHRRQQQRDVEMNGGDCNARLTNSFLSEVEEVRELIEKVNANIDLISVKQKSIGTPKDEGTRRLEDIFDDVKHEALKIKQQLQSIDKQTDDIEKSSPDSTECRIRRTQQSMLWQMFRETMAKYNKVQLEYKEKCKNIIKIQLEVMGKETTDTELEAILEHENTAVFTQEFVKQTQEARVTLSNIEARHKDIILIEKSIKELRDLFVEMALTVEQQGETLNRIETHVLSSKNFVKKAENELGDAEVTRKRSRKMKIWCYLLLVIALVVLILVVVFSLK